MRNKVALAPLMAFALIGAGQRRSGNTTYVVGLTGAAESNIAHPSGGTGDLTDSGYVKLTIDPARRLLCYRFKLSGMSTPLMAHIHQGIPMQIGPPVVTLFTGPGARLADCVIWTRGQLAEIVANPADYYVNIATIDFPDGALRGQLATSAQ